MSIGEALASARQERDLTVDEVAQATRVRGTLIRAIERDDFSLCGGAVYARGHIRSIGRAVGLDPEPLVAEFDRVHGSVPQLVTDTIFEAETRAKPERTGPRWGVAMMAAVLVGICAVALASIFSAHDGGRPAAQSGHRTPGGTTAPAATHPSTSPPAHHTRPPATDAPVAQEPRDGVNVRIRITGSRSWVSVRDAAGTTLVQKTFTRGQVFDAHDAKLLHLVLGDAGQVDLIVNGKELGPPGGAGDVVQLTFHPGDPATSSQG